MEEVKKVYELGKGIEFTVSRQATIDAIDKNMIDLTAKAEANEDPKMKKFYKRVTEDPEFRTRRVVAYTLTHI